MAIDQEYALETPNGVYALLSNIHYVRSAALDKSDFDAINLLLDLDIARKKVITSQRQNEAMELVFEEGLTQREAADLMGITQQAVQQLVWSVINRIAEQYKADLNIVEGETK